MSVYLDHNAGAPVRPEAVAAVAAALAEGGNPSSVHAAGRAARARMERARHLIAQAISARPEDLTVTSGGTEANNLAIVSARAAGAARLVVSAIEHDAVRTAAARSGLPVEVWPVAADGRADLNWLEDRLKVSDSKRETILFSLMAANNETGVVQPYAAAGRMIREADHQLHVDAVQMLGRAPFDFAGSLAHFAAFSAHKLGGPQGAGALATACEVPPAALVVGGGQEKGRRGGTENVPGVAGFAAALEAAQAGLEAETGRLKAMRAGFEAKIKAAGAHIWGEGAERLPNTSCLSAPGWNSEIQVIALDLAGFAVSAGSACSSGKVRKSAVLAAMGAGEAHAASALRVSFGWTNTKADAEAAAAAWIDGYARVRPRAVAV